jgi:hypothetical protein
MKRKLVFLVAACAASLSAHAEKEPTPTVVNPSGYRHGLGAENPAASANQPVPRPKKPKKVKPASAASIPAASGVAE